MTSTILARSSLPFSPIQCSGNVLCVPLWQLLLYSISILTEQAGKENQVGRRDCSLPEIRSLVLFQVTASQIWRGFELIPFAILGITGGVFGHYFIRSNIAYAKFRARELANHPILEVAAVSLLTALVSYLIVYTR